MIKSGIYKILNTLTDKVYIGSAISINRRWNEHKKDLVNNKHHSVYLQNAWNKYGSDVFQFTIIEIVEDKNKLIEREQYWFNITKCFDKNFGYNVRIKPDSNLGLKRTEEAKKKMSLASKGKRKSKEHRLNLSKAKLGKSVNQKLDVWPHGSKCLCSECKIIRNRYNILRRNNRLQEWYLNV